MRTLEELERLMYIEGHVEEARLLRAVVDAEAERDEAWDEAGSPCPCGCEN